MKPRRRPYRSTEDCRSGNDIAGTVPAAICLPLLAALLLNACLPATRPGAGDSARVADGSGRSASTTPCADEARTIFHCTSASQMLSLCATTPLDQPDALVRFRAIIREGAGVLWIDEGELPARQLQFNTHTHADGSVAEIRFGSPHADYQLFERAPAEGFTAESDHEPGVRAGVVMTRHGEQRQWACAGPEGIRAAARQLPQARTIAPR